MRYRNSRRKCGAVADYAAPSTTRAQVTTQVLAPSGDASVPHYLSALRATHTRCPIPLRALVGFAYLRFTIYDLDVSALARGLA